MKNSPFVRFVAAVTVAVATVAVASSASAGTPYTYSGATGAPTIGIITDSAGAGIRYYNAYDPLKILNFRYDGEVCRRTLAPSCRSTEGFVPPTALQTLRAASGNWGDLLVMFTGYNDGGVGFADAVDAIMAEANRQGIPKVMWLTMRTAPVYYPDRSFVSRTYTFKDNNLILLLKSEQYGDRLQIADWATFSKTQSSWFASDGIHFTPAGARAAAEFVAQTARRVLNGETVTPPRSSTPANHWVDIGYGDRGTRVADVERALINAGIPVFGGVDGIYDSYTVNAVKTFQQRKGITATGTVDEATALKLGITTGVTMTLKDLTCVGREATRILTQGDDRYTGTSGDDVIVGLGGNDIIDGGGGNDYICGGPGDDILRGGAGNDRLHGDAGDDILRGGDGDDQLYGFDGRDELYGNAGNDLLHGGGHDDKLYGGPGDDHLLGAIGNDRLDGGIGADLLEGNVGNDILRGGPGNDRLDGGAGNDILKGDRHDDELIGGPGDDVLWGGPGNDSLDGGDGHDDLYGGSGDDVLSGGNHPDRLFGGIGRDTLHGGDGPDLLRGNLGPDILYGNEGRDRLYGGGGPDEIYGGSGDDQLWGGPGNDLLRGNAGYDELDGGSGIDHCIGELTANCETIG